MVLQFGKRGENLSQGSGPTRDKQSLGRATSWGQGWGGGGAGSPAFLPGPASVPFDSLARDLGQGEALGEKMAQTRGKIQK